MANDTSVSWKWVLVFLLLAIGLGALTVLFLGGSLIAT